MTLAGLVSGVTFGVLKLNASKSNTMIVSRSLTMHPQSPTFTIGTVLKESDDLVILRVTFDSKMTSVCSVSRANSQRLGIVRRS